MAGQEFLFQSVHLYVAPSQTKDTSPHPARLQSHILLIPARAVTFGSVCSVLSLTRSIIYMALDQNIRGPRLFCGVITKGRATGRCKHQWVIPSSLERLLKVDKKERESLISQGLLESPPPQLPSPGNASVQAECQRNKFNQNLSCCVFSPLWSLHPLVQRVQANMLHLIPPGHNMRTTPSFLQAV